MASLDLKKLSKEEVERALKLLEKDIERKEKIKRGEIKAGLKWSEMSEEQKAAARAAAKRRQAKINVIVRKALAAGITVSEKEIEAELAKKGA